MNSPQLFQDDIPPADERGEVATAERVAESEIDETSPVDADKFDWGSDDSVIVQEQLAIAVYRNRANGVVIRQEARSFDEDDQFVILRDAEAVRILLRALRREAGGGA